jgi:hypothetical protein
MRSTIAVACILLGTCVPAGAQVSIGINVQAYPELVAVPGYPVYYAPQLDSNFFFYDGLYWVYAQDNWYASSWYNGPWEMVAPESVPFFVLRVPVRYYRQPPGYFGGWAPEAPPRWGEHWGRNWEQRRGGWDQWDRASAPAPAPLPTYQRAYSGERYPRVDQQLALRNQNYHYQPGDAAVRQQFQHAPAQAAPPQRQVQAERDRPSTPPPDIRRGNAAVAAETAAAPRRAESHPPSGGQAADVAHPAPVERGKPPDIRRGNAPVAAESAAAPGRAESHPPSAGHAAEVTHPAQAERGKPPQAESQPSRSREQTDRKPASAPAQAPKGDAEHERDH